jgi:3-deoxy-D-manno-octulosonic-acid transferase
MARAGKYRAGLKERLGFVPHRLRPVSPPGKAIWFHAVSVGEVLAISGLVNLFRAELPGSRLVISTTTLTGQKLARERFGSDNVFYLPLDLPWALAPYVRAVRPQMLVLAETEFWPNLLHIVKKRYGARIAVVNARISDRSFPGYRRFRVLLKRVLGNVDLFLAQTDLDRQRLIDIGAPCGKVELAGNLKFDVKPAAESELSRSISAVLAPDQRVLVFGSTVAGEEDLLLPCFKSVLAEIPQALIVVAPRHPERFDGVAELLRSSGISFWRRSAWAPSPFTRGVLLLDSIGELASLYALADVAFVGGSLVPRGGHNILEPAQYAKPIVIGPYYNNFREIVQLFLAHDAVRVAAPGELTTVLLELLHSPERARHLGSRAWSVVEGGRGSTRRTLDALASLLERHASTAPLSVPRA